MSSAEVNWQSEAARPSRMYKLLKLTPPSCQAYIRGDELNWHKEGFMPTCAHIDMPNPAVPFPPHAVGLT